MYNLFRFSTNLNREQRRILSRQFRKQFDSIVKFLKKLPDTRDQNKIKFPYWYCLSLLLLALVAGVPDCTNAALFLEENWDLIKRFVPSSYRFGIPNRYDLCNCLIQVDTVALRKAFKKWISSYYKPDKGKKRHYALDGTLPKASRPKQRGMKHYLVEVYDVSEALTLDLMEVEEKSNEKTACVALLSLLDLDGAVITTDSLNTTNNVMKTALEKGGDFILPIKDNRSANREELETFFNEYIKSQEELEKKREVYKELGHECKDKDYLEIYEQKSEKNSNRVETRKCFYTDQLDGFELSNTTGVKSVAKIERHVQEPEFKDGKLSGTKEYDEEIYIICSYTPGAEELLLYVREHWKIESTLHWVKDNYLREDRSTNRKGFSRANFGLLRRVVLNIFTLGNEILEDFEKKTTPGKIIILKSNLHLALMLVFGYRDDWNIILSNYYEEQAKLYKEIEKQKTVPPVKIH